MHILRGRHVFFLQSTQNVTETKASNIYCCAKLGVPMFLSLLLHKFVCHVGITGVYGLQIGHTKTKFCEKPAVQTFMGG